ncbi:hypothetical protein [Flagellimonas aequoris]|uniref:Uncharacterized protein n=1 Tax=Flagellimonas aequoris TaxID=2306997 RepID=A0A418N9U3_9FLAO|nr:hypothetical protein [Allomuricauda aequoris]RIV72440.1 hypothetical protein D2U88_05270 [Allomuricauda aequoris]TXK05024.1 hypothetical protein FQ019_05230 [Allomuricauda aequoris]
MNERKTFTRVELYSLVWEQSLNDLSERLEVTQQQLKAVCREYNIPLPNRGHWTKVRFNKQITKTPLPKMENRGININLASDPKPKKFKTSYHKRAYELEHQSNLLFKVPKRIVQYHPTIRKSKKLLQQLDESKDAGFWELSQEHEILPIHTDPKMRSRAFRFMNTLIMAIEAMNGKIIFEYGRCHIELFGQKTEINLRQKYHRIREKDKSGWSRESWKKSEKLEFQAGPSFRHKSWIDRKTIRLEEYLPQIVAWIEKDCKYWHDLRAQQAEQKRRREQELLKEKELLKKIAEEKSKLRQLISDSENWYKAKQIRGYLSAYKDKVEQNKSLLNEEIKVYLNWANQKADWLDPLTKFKDPILGKSDLE